MSSGWVCLRSPMYGPLDLQIVRGVLRRVPPSHPLDPERSLWSLERDTRLTSRRTLWTEYRSRNLYLLDPNSGREPSRVLSRSTRNPILRRQPELDLVHVHDRIELPILVLNVYPPRDRTIVKVRKPVQSFESCPVPEDLLFPPVTLTRQDIVNKSRDRLRGTLESACPPLRRGLLSRTRSQSPDEVRLPTRHVCRLGRPSTFKPLASFPTTRQETNTLVQMVIRPVRRPSTNRKSKYFTGGGRVSFTLFSKCFTKIWRKVPRRWHLNEVSSLSKVNSPITFVAQLEGLFLLWGLNDVYLCLCNNQTSTVQWTNVVLVLTVVLYR